MGAHLLNSLARRGLLPLPYTVSDAPKDWPAQPRKASGGRPQTVRRGKASNQGFPGPDVPAPHGRTYLSMRQDSPHFCRPLWLCDHKEETGDRTRGYTPARLGLRGYDPGVGALGRVHNIAGELVVFLAVGGNVRLSGLTGMKTDRPSVFRPAHEWSKRKHKQAYQKPLPIVRPNHR